MDSNAGGLEVCDKNSIHQKNNHERRARIIEFSGDNASDKFYVRTIKAKKNQALLMLALK